MSIEKPQDFGGQENSRTGVAFQERQMAVGRIACGRSAWKWGNDLRMFQAPNEQSLARLRFCYLQKHILLKTRNVLKKLIVLIWGSSLIF